MELLKNLEGMSADEQMTAVVELQKAAMKHLEEQKQVSIGKSAEMVIQGLKKIKNDLETRFDVLNLDIQTKVSSLKDGEQGLQGEKGEKGDRGLDGANGKEGRDGKDGRDGQDGVDGVGVRDAKIDFDGSLVISLTDGREINCGEVVSVDVAKQIQKVTHNIQTGSGGDSQTVLDAIAALQATIATYGTMATQNANNVAITGGNINGTTIGGTTPAAGTFTTLGVTTSINASGAGSNIDLTLLPKGTGLVKSSASYGVTAQSTSAGGFFGSGLGFDQTVTAAYSYGRIQPYSLSDGLMYLDSAFSGGGFVFRTTTTLNTQFRISNTASAVNYVQVTGSATTKGTVLSAQGSDSNISQVFQSKGTGAIDLAAGSSGVNISNGGTVTAITRTAGGSAYATAPTVTISPPTTAGGVQATATCTVTAGVVDTTFTITNAGSGYVEQPTVSFSGGGGSGAAAIAAVGSGTVVRSINGTMSFFTPAGESVRIDNPNYSTLTDYVALAGGASVSGAYVSVGGSTTNSNLYVSAKGTGSVAFFTNGQGSARQLNVSHTASAVNYVQVTGAATGGGPTISAQGSDSNISLFLNAKGTGNVFAQVGGANVFQAAGSSFSANRILVQANNAGTAPIVQSVGSDTNIDLALTPKGTGALVAQASDGGTTINARGANAVDWQTSRNSASMVASGSNSVLVGGQNNTSSSYTSFLGAGANNYSQASNSFVGAGNANLINLAGNYAAIVAGNGNTAQGYANFIGAGTSNSGTSGSAVTTQSATMNGTTAVTLSGSNASIKVGQLIVGTSIASETYVAAVSGTSLTLSKNASGSSTSTLSFYTPHGVVVGGGNNQATGAYSFIGGGGDAGTAANRNVASGDWSVVSGGYGNQATGLGSIVCGGGWFSAGSSFAQSASGVGAGILSGSGNYASGDRSAVLTGYNNGATATSSLVGGGFQSVATGQYSTAINGYQLTTRGIYGSVIFGGRSGFGLGGGQAGNLVLTKQTTDATPTVLVSDTGGAGTTNQVIMPNNSAYYFRGEVISGVTGGGNTKGWYIEGVIKRGANAASTALVGIPTVTSNYADVGASTWTIAVTADTTNGGLAVTFTGQASTTIRTVARINTVEMTY